MARVREVPKHAAPRGAGGGPSGSTASLARWAPIALIAIGSVVVLVLFLSPYASRLSTPIGGDTPWYVGRQKLIEADGLDALGRLHLPGIPLKPLGDRPGYPVAAALVSAVTRIGAFDLVFVLPAVVALIVGLAAAALSVEVLSEPRWAAAVYLVGVGASVFIARTAVMSYDNLIVDSLLIATVACAVLVCDGRAATAAAVFLLGAAALTHWRFLIPFVALLLGLSVYLVPDALRRRRRGERILRTPAGRLAVLIGAVVAAGAAALGLAPSGSLKIPEVQAARITSKTDEWMPGFRLPVTGPWAALGAVALWRPRDDKRRWALVLMALWALSVPAAWLVSHRLGTTVPIYRVTAFALGIPVLASAAVVGLARLVGSRWGAVGRALAALVVLTGVALTLWIAEGLWSAQLPVVEPEDVRELGVASTYLSAVGAERPVVFVVEVGTGTQPQRAIRALLPPDVANRSALYLGTPENVLAGVPTVDRENTRLNRKALAAWKLVRPLLSRDPVILRLSAFSGGVGPTGSWPAIGPGVSLVQGPPPTTTIAAPVVEARGVAWLAWGALAVLAVAALVGFGWSVALVPASALARGLLAPAFGLAALVVFGFVAGRLGVVPSGSGPIGVTAVAAAGGWIVRGVRGIARPGSRRGSTAEEPAPEDLETRP